MDQVLKEALEKERSKTIATILDYLIGFALVFPATLLRGYVMHVLWGWFLVSLLQVHPSIFHCIGLSLVLQMFNPKYGKVSEPALGWHGLDSALNSIVYLGFGYIAKYFM